jgi:hypothetical protein
VVIPMRFIRMIQHSSKSLTVKVASIPDVELSYVTDSQAAQVYSWWQDYLEKRYGEM